MFDKLLILQSHFFFFFQTSLSPPHLLCLPFIALTSPRNLMSKKCVDIYFPVFSFFFVVVDYLLTKVPFFTINWLRHAQKYWFLDYVLNQLDLYICQHKNICCMLLLFFNVFFLFVCCYCSFSLLSFVDLFSCVLNISM